MVNRVKFSVPTSEEVFEGNQKADENCCIYGCPMPGHILNSGNWNCRYHYGQNGEDLSRITKILRNHLVLFKWHSTLLQFTIVDFLVGEVAKCAPRGLQPEAGQTFKEYKTSLTSQIDDLLKGKVTA